MQDGILVEFEEQLPLKEYAIRIPSFMWFRTPEILQLFIDSGRVKEMQVETAFHTRKVGGAGHRRFLC